MKIIILLLVTFAPLYAFSQRLAYVHTEYIFKHLPEYVSATKKIQGLSKQWEEEVQKRLDKVAQLQEVYQAERILLTEEMSIIRENEIKEQKKAVLDFQKQKFGPEGELIQLDEKLIRPIQKKIAKAIQAVASANNLDIVIDKSSEVIMLYANPRYDKSDAVITHLGFKPGIFAQ